MMVEFLVLTYPVALTTAQLSFLLTIVHADRLFGADNQQLFPEDDEKRTQLWQTGLQQLEQDNWMIKEGNIHNPNDQLLLLVVTMAAAKIIIVSQITVPEQPPQGVTHYVSDKSVIEVVYQDGIYQLTALDSLAVMANRLTYTFDLPAITQENIVFEMTQDQIRQSQSALDTRAAANIRLSGIPENASQLYVNTMLHLKHKGRVQLVRIGQDSEMVARKQLGVLVSSEKVALTAVPHQQKTIYQTTNSDAFQHILLEMVEQLKGEPDA